jgi:hypothetical protein
MDETIRTKRRRHYSIRTERSYSLWVKRYVAFHKMRGRVDLFDGEKKIEKGERYTFKHRLVTGCNSLTFPERSFI